VDHRDYHLSQRAASKTELAHKTEKQIANCNKIWSVEGAGGTQPVPEKRDRTKK
jgi:hypothetical protein